MRTPLIILGFLLTMFTSVGQTKSSKSQTKNTGIDTLYIPIDLNDCYIQLDKLFSDSTKTKIKAMAESDFSARIHLNFGMWLRNNWGLWKGSRLSKFFNTNGIYHPDDMSGIIIDSYYRYLHGQDIKLDEQIKYYQDYWEKVKKDGIVQKTKAFAQYKTGDTVTYNYRLGFASKAQEKKYDDDVCSARAIIISLDQDKFFIRVRLLEGCDSKGIIYQNSSVYKKTNDSWEKTKKKIVTYMKPGEENWFDFSDWEANN